MTDGLDRLKVLINSSTPIVVMETSEEMHAVNMVRAACSELKMATFEWSIADGLRRSGSNTVPEGQKMSLQARIDQATGWSQGGRAQTQTRTVLSPTSGEAERLTRSVMSSMGAEGSAAAAAGTPRFNTREPVQALANMESMTVEAVFILKDFHRHLDDPVVVRRLRDVGEKFSANCGDHPPRTLRSDGTDYAGGIFRSPVAGPRPAARNRARHVHTALQNLFIEAAVGCCRCRCHVCQPARAYRRRGGARGFTSFGHAVCAVCRDCDGCSRGQEAAFAPLGNARVH